jgi:hypothetical protein
MEYQNYSKVYTRSDDPKLASSIGHPIFTIPTSSHLRFAPNYLKPDKSQRILPRICGGAKMDKRRMGILELTRKI